MFLWSFHVHCGVVFHYVNIAMFILDGHLDRFQVMVITYNTVRHILLWILDNGIFKNMF